MNVSDFRIVKDNRAPGDPRASGMTGSCPFFITYPLDNRQLYVGIDEQGLLTFEHDLKQRFWFKSPEEATRRLEQAIEYGELNGVPALVDVRSISIRVPSASFERVMALKIACDPYTRNVSQEGVFGANGGTVLLESILFEGAFAPGYSPSELILRFRYSSAGFKQNGRDTYRIVHWELPEDIMALVPKVEEWIVD